ncbi:MAG: GNAT family N-acetyltransferase [Breznakibacter sp.]
MDDGFRYLIALLDNDLNGRYLSAQAEYDKYNKVDLTDTVIVALEENSPVGCGCFKQYGHDTVEIKRMFVVPGYRGKGISKLILGGLEVWAEELGYSKAILETGIKQPEAIGLYEKAGYDRIENYGQYRDLPHSICFGKELASDRRMFINVR